MELLSAIVDYLADPATYEGRYALQNLLGQHLYYMIASTLLAVAIAVPLGLWVGHRGRGELVVVNVTNIGRAVPDFGVLIIAFVWLGLNAGPVIVALVALAVPPILINTYIGVRQVDPDVRDSAEGMGMTGWQVLSRVEVPIALPLVMTGVRTAAVQVVATATLAGYVGLGGFGRLIFDVIAVGVRPNLDRLVVACVAVAALAVLTELGLARVERRLTPAGAGAPDDAEPTVEEAPPDAATTTKAA